MVDITDIAEHILAQAGSVATMKLQKLVYYSQVRHIIAYNEPLFANRIEAWRNGPVVPDLYKLHSGRYIISEGYFNKNATCCKLSACSRNAIDKAVEIFGDKAGDKLREITHSEKPWIDARGDCKPSDSCNAEITVEAIREYYTSSECTNPIVQ